MSTEMDDKYLELLKKNSEIEEIYKGISQRFGNREVTIEKIDSKKVQELIERNGYSCRHNKNEKFLKVVVLNGKYKIGYNLDLEYGLVEFILFIFKDKKCIDGGSVSWMFLNEEDRPIYPMPKFSTYEELEEILLPMFEVIKTFEAEKVFDQNE